MHRALHAFRPAKRADGHSGGHTGEDPGREILQHRGLRGSHGGRADRGRGRAGGGSRGGEQRHRRRRDRHAGGPHPLRCERGEHRGEHGRTGHRGRRRSDGTGVAGPQQILLRRTARRLCLLCEGMADGRGRRADRQPGAVRGARLCGAGRRRAAHGDGAGRAGRLPQRRHHPPADGHRELPGGGGGPLRHQPDILDRQQRPKERGHHSGPGGGGGGRLRELAAQDGPGHQPD